MMFFNKAKKEKLKQIRTEEERLLKNWDIIKANYEKTIAEDRQTFKILVAESRTKIEELKADNERLIQKCERLRIEEEQLDRKRKQVEAGQDPQQLFILAIDKTFDFVWDVNKKITQQIIDKVRDEDSEYERERYSKTIEEYKKNLLYVAEGIATPETIAKIKKTLEDNYVVAERENKQPLMETIKEDLDFLRRLKIIK